MRRVLGCKTVSFSPLPNVHLALLTPRCRISGDGELIGDVAVVDVLGVLVNMRNGNACHDRRRHTLPLLTSHFRHANDGKSMRDVAVVESMDGTNGL